MPHGLTESGAFFACTVCINPYCQIEHVFSDNDTGTPCSNRAVAECADCGAATVLTAGRSAAEIPSAVSAVTGT